MTTKSFEQTSLMRSAAPIFNILAFLMPIFYEARFAFRAFQSGREVTPITWLVTIFYMALLWIGLMIPGNYFCEIFMDETGLSVTFLWRKYHVNWEDIVKVKRIGLFGRASSWVVLTNKGLTPFHRLYGLFYAFSWLPGFIISDTLNNKEELAQLIADRTGDKITEKHVKVS